jgi:predicted phage terminase large subunit-like protein
MCQLLLYHIITFIASNVFDNEQLMQKNPEYVANLMALNTVDREQLLNGNWNIRASAGLYFNRARVNMLNKKPLDIMRTVRAWDIAGGTKGTDDFTSGVLLGERSDGRIVVLDVINRRITHSDVRNLILNTAMADGVKTRIRLSQDPGQAGKEQAETYLKMLHGFSVNVEVETGSKVVRAEPFSSQWQGISGSEKGNIDVLVGEWNNEYFSQLEGFPEAKHDDMVDSSANAYLELMKMKKRVVGVL